MKRILLFLLLISAKGSTEAEYAMVWSVDSSATSNINSASVNKLISDAQTVRNFYNSTKTNCLLNINIGIKENNNLNHLIQVYPNPANNFITLKSDIALQHSKIELTDVTGRLIQTIKSTDLNQTTINIINLNDGIYFLNITFDNTNKVVKKFIKQ